jgi:uncharacterized protein
MARKSDINYFDVLIKAAEYANLTAMKVNDLLVHYDNVHDKAEAIHDLEHGADQEVHLLMDALNRAFITPIEREDILGLINSLDNITDLLEDVSNRFDMFNVTQVRPESLKFGILMETATKTVLGLMQAFKYHKRNKQQIHDLVMSVNTIEEDGDRLYRESIKNLFINEKDILEIMKWKDIFDDMENVFDACEDVADIVEAVDMKNT